MITQLVLLAGGKGTRLREVLGETPKALAEIGGKPLLMRQIEAVEREGVSEILLLTGSGGEQIQEFVQKNPIEGVRICIEREVEPLGTAGALAGVHEKLQDEFFICYGDTLFDLSLGDLATCHNGAGADITLLVHPGDHPQDSDLVELGVDGSIVRFHKAPHGCDLPCRNLGNAAFYVVRKKALLPYLSLMKGKDLARDLFPHLLESGAKLVALGTREYIKDMGTPERLQKVRRDDLEGLPKKRHSRRAIGAIFLDRDGTLNLDAGWIAKPSNVVLCPGVGHAVKQVNRSGRMAIVITNQPVLARGECDEAMMEKIHARLESLLAGEGAYLDDIFYCPHHPERGWPGEREDLKIVCDCRKPAPGLLLSAMNRWNIDPLQSWMIGDSWRDIAAAKGAGIRSVFLTSNEASAAPEQSNFPPDRTAPDLAAAIDDLIREGLL